MPAKDGYVRTPVPVADVAAMTLFGVNRPGDPPGDNRDADDDGRLLLPGLGTGNLYDGARRYWTEGQHWRVPEWSYPAPESVGVEKNATRIGAFEMTHADSDVEVHHADFLLDPPAGPFDWVLANPPYTRYRRIDEDRRERYRDRFDTATGQFPLYAPFVEQSLDLLRPGGEATFILPTKALTLHATEPLRELVGQYLVEEIRFLPPQTFDRTVKTLLITIMHKDKQTKRFWLEPLFNYTSDTEELLRRLGVPDVESAHERYMKELERTEMRISPETGLNSPITSVDTVDETKGEEEERQAEQAHLREWSA